MVALLVMIGLVAAVALVAVVMHNRMVALGNRLESAWSTLDVELARRSALVPQLAEVVRRYASHERGALDAAIIARLEAGADALDAATTTATAAGDQTARGEVEEATTVAVRSVLAVAESYPALSADRSFSRLHAELSETEDRIASSRESYNEAVLAFNTAISSFPMILMARAMRLTVREYLQETSSPRPEGIRF